MRKFNPNARCPKCDHDYINTWYSEACELDSLSCDCPLEYPERHHPHLHRECGRCKYEWCELPLDAKQLEVEHGSAVEEK